MWCMFPSYAGGIGFHYGLVSAACKKIYTIMAEVIKKVINDHGLGCWWGGCVDMGFGTYVLGGHLQ